MVRLALELLHSLHFCKEVEVITSFGTMVLGLDLLPIEELMETRPECLLEGGSYRGESRKSSGDRILSQSLAGS